MIVVGEEGIDNFREVILQFKVKGILETRIGAPIRLFFDALIEYCLDLSAYKSALQHVYPKRFIISISSHAWHGPICRHPFSGFGLAPTFVPTVENPYFRRERTTKIQLPN